MLKHIERKRNYLKAAALISDVAGDLIFCCNLLNIEEGAAFRAMFAPTEDEVPNKADWCGFEIGAWGKHWAEESAPAWPKRVLALCFAAAMVETGDL